MDLAPFQFDLPEDRIALRPADPQDSARLLVVHADGRLEDRTMLDLPTCLRSGDQLVFNDTRVIPAALRAVRPARDAAGRDVSVDLNLVEPRGPNVWVALARPGRRLSVGDRLHIAPDFHADLLEKTDGGTSVLHFHPPDGSSVEATLEQVGQMPLPPYIARRRGADARDRSTYQTRFASDDARSVAAPTAGLHFTDRLLAAIDSAGAVRQTVRLHVGLGTFAPLDDRALAQNALHTEWCRLEAGTAAALNTARGAGQRIIPVGTTSLRTLETACDEAGQFAPFAGGTDIFLKPGDRYLATDALITNFHLPGSSLFMLVCGLMGTDIMRAAYAHAIAEAYRFYSYGDACLLLPEPSRP
ncbi:MAG: tRNA preQ1(34) S-adenosylmethionine ribosyltransferase-isomerase QueA [Pseudomonadota bacterium]